MTGKFFVVVTLGMLVTACGPPGQSAAPAVKPLPGAKIATEAVGTSGLSTEYFNSTDLSGAALWRNDQTVNFDWGYGSPLGGVRTDRFSARFTGEVSAPTSGLYTFYVTADDGMRLDVGGKRLVNDFTDHPPTMASGQIELVAGQRPKINLEYYENGGQASLKLEWSGPNLARQVVPASALFSGQESSPATSTGRTFWVAQGGNDGNPGTEAQPWGNLNYAAQTIKPGDTVLVKNGTYPGVYVSNSGAPGKPITFRAAPGAKPNIFITEINSAGFLLEGASYVNIEGFNLDYRVPGVENSNGERWEAGIVIKSRGDEGPGRINSHHVRASGNRVHGFPGGGIGSGQADYITIEGNTIWETAFYSYYDTSAVSLYQSRNVDSNSGFHNIIRANTIFRNENKVPDSGINPNNPRITDGNCIIIDDGRNTQKIQKDQTTYPAFTGATLVENNICADNGGRGINVFSSDNVLIRNNTFYKNGRTPNLDSEVSVLAASNVRVVNNIIVPRDGQRATSVYDGDVAEFQVSNVVFANNLYFGSGKLPQRGASDLVADPQFVSPGNDVNTANFRLKPGSPAIDKALSTEAPPTDVGGLSRPVGAGPDIGAWEAR
jgi:parallel beta-helix repeat protein